MAVVTIETKKFNDEEVEITFNAKAGKFFATFDTVSYDSKTLEDIVDQLTRAAKAQKKIDPIPVSIVSARWGRGEGRYDTQNDLRTGTEERGNSIDCVFRGRNPRTRAFLLTVEGKKLSLETYRRGDTVITRRLTPAEHAQYKALSATVAAAEKDLEAFVQSVKLDIDKALGEKEE